MIGYDTERIVDIYRIRVALKVETDIITGIAASPIGQVVIPVIMYVCGYVCYKTNISCDLYVL
jgi:hypothetical protein